MVSLRSPEDYSILCSGALICGNVVITSASCIMNTTMFVVHIYSENTTVTSHQWPMMNNMTIKQSKEVATLVIDHDALVPEPYVSGGAMHGLPLHQEINDPISCLLRLVAKGPESCRPQKFRWNPIPADRSSWRRPLHTNACPAGGWRHHCLAMEQWAGCCSSTTMMELIRHLGLPPTLIAALTERSRGPFSHRLSLRQKYSTLGRGRSLCPGSGLDLGTLAAAMKAIFRQVSTIHTGW